MEAANLLQLFKNKLSASCCINETVSLFLFLLSILLTFDFLLFFEWDYNNKIIITFYLNLEPFVKNF